MVWDAVTIGTNKRLNEIGDLNRDGLPGNHGVRAIFFCFSLKFGRNWGSIAVDMGSDPGCLIRVRREQYERIGGTQKCWIVFGG